MKSKFLCMLTIIGAVLFISPSPLVLAKENADDYTIVDMQTGAKETIDLDEEQYNDVEEFVSQSSFSSSISNSGNVLAVFFARPFCRKMQNENVGCCNTVL